MHPMDIVQNVEKTLKKALNEVLLCSHQSVKEFIKACG